LLADFGELFLEAFLEREFIRVRLSQRQLDVLLSLRQLLLTSVNQLDLHTTQQLQQQQQQQYYCCYYYCQLFSVGNSREVRYIMLLTSENQTLNLMLYHFAKY